MVRMADDNSRRPDQSGAALEARLYRGFVERGIARRLLDAFYPDMQIERIAAMMPMVCLTIAPDDAELATLLGNVPFRQRVIAAVTRAMKDVLLDIGEATP